MAKEMSRGEIFVIIMMILQVLAILGYVFEKNWGLVFYWTACLTINYVVTYVLG